MPEVVYSPHLQSAAGFRDPVPFAWLYLQKKKESSFPHPRALAVTLISLSPCQTSTENKQPQTSAVRAGFQRGFLHPTPLDSPSSLRCDGKRVSPGCLLRKVGKPAVCFQPEFRRGRAWS